MPTEPNELSLLKNWKIPVVVTEQEKPILENLMRCFNTGDWVWYEADGQKIFKILDGDASKRDNPNYVAYLVVSTY